MKTILMSIRPEWCELIISGRKSLELRKQHPKEKGPFRVLVYCSSGGKKIYRNGNLLNGNIIGEFVCPVIADLGRVCDFSPGKIERIEALSCVKWEHMLVYAEPKPLHGWVISDYFSYVTPKTLGEIGVKRAPQSWQYICV